MKQTYFDAHDNVVENVDFDHNTGMMHVERMRDVTDLIESNKKIFNNADKSYKDEVFNLVGRFDSLAAEQWCTNKGIKYSEFLSDPKMVKRFLNDPDNAVWKLKPGKV